VAIAGHAVQIADLAADADYRGSGYTVGGFRTLLGVPIRSDGELIGTFGLGRKTVLPFSDAEIELVSLFADQAAIAIRVARLLTETHEALERETAVGEVLQTISRSTFDLQQVLQTVIDSATRLSHADEGNIVREENGRFRMAAYTEGVPARFREIIDQLDFKPERGTITGRVLMERGPVQIEDIKADPEYAHLEAQVASGFRTVLAVPLLREAIPIGVLIVWRLDVRRFSAAEVGLMQTFADQAAIAIANVRLFETVERQRTELARFAPQVAGLLTSAEGEQLLAGHRREISAMFCDLRGFTAFAETAEPEELLSVLRSYHAAVGEASVAEGGTVEHFAGDGLMVFFNDPAPIADHQLAAVRTACAVRDRFTELAAAWRKRGYELGMGIGIASGYATLGRIGFEGRYDYGAMGIVVNLASRLSDAAEGGQILISQRHYAAVEDAVQAAERPPVTLKGFGRPIPVWAVEAVRTQA
jgi:class 3 adenylate cyclase